MLAVRTATDTGFGFYQERPCSLGCTGRPNMAVAALPPGTRAGLGAATSAIWSNGDRCHHRRPGGSSLTSAPMARRGKAVELVAEAADGAGDDLDDQVSRTNWTDAVLRPSWPWPGRHRTGAGRVSRPRWRRWRRIWPATSGRYATYARLLVEPDDRFLTRTDVAPAPGGAGPALPGARRCPPWQEAKWLARRPAYVAIMRA